MAGQVKMSGRADTRHKGVWLDMSVGVKLNRGGNGRGVKTGKGQAAWVLFLLIIFLLWSNTRADLLANDGVLVTSVGTGRVVSGVWSVIVLIDPPIPPNMTDLVGQLNEYIARLTPYVRQQEKELWEARVREYQARLTYAMGETDTGPAESVKRIRRALLDFVGRVQRAVFGVATMEDVQHVLNEVEVLRKSSRVVSHDTRRMLTYVNATRKLVAENRQDIAQLVNRTEQFAHLLTYIRRDALALTSAVRILESSRIVDQVLLLLDQAATKFSMEAMAFHQKRAELERGFLTEDLLSMTHLQEARTHLIALGHFPLPPTWYYQFVKIVPLWNNGAGQLAYGVVLPAVSRTDYMLYGLQYFPVAYGPTHLRKMNGRPTVAVSTATGETFAPTGEDCAGQHPMVCYPVAQNSKTMCETALIFGKRPTACNVTIMTAPKAPSAVYRGHANLSMVIVVPYKTVQVTLRCLGVSPVTKLVSRVTLYHLLPKCALESDGWTVKGIDLGFSRIHLHPRPPLVLPAMNFTWPEMASPAVLKLVKFKTRASVPLISLHSWGMEGDTDVVHGNDVFVHPVIHYMGEGLGALSVLISLSVVGYLWWKAMTRRRASYNIREPTAPIYLQEPLLTQEGQRGDHSAPPVPASHVVVNNQFVSAAHGEQVEPGTVERVTIARERAVMGQSMIKGEPE